MANTKQTTAKKNADTPKTKATPQRQTACKGKNCVEAAQECCRLTDYDIISDVLGSHKNLVKLYGTALCETDCEQLRKIINTKMSECAVDQYDAFKYMNDRGMYKVESAPATKVKTARGKYSKCIQNFSDKKGDKQ